MILTLDKLLRNHLVDGAVKNDKNNIDDTGCELQLKRNVLAVLLDVVLSPDLHCYLRTDHEYDEEHRDWDADKDLAIVCLDTAHLLSLLGLLVDDECSTELFTLGRWINVVPHQPHVTNHVFFAFPALHEVSGPQYYEDCIDTV